eukprot:COSAG01_NODE_47567_length_389_cov_0.731034_2_plen_73_part_01
MVTRNMLKNYPPLPKVHFSWPIPSPYGSNLSFADGVWSDYVRITGSFPVMARSMASFVGGQAVKRVLTNGAIV